MRRLAPTPATSDARDRSSPRARARAKRSLLVLAATMLLGACASTPPRNWVADFAPDHGKKVVWVTRGEPDGGDMRLYLGRGDAEGGMAWQRELPREAGVVYVHGDSLSIVGDAVLLTLRQEYGDPSSDAVTGVHAFSLDDGTPRWQDLEGYGSGEEDLWPFGSYGDRRQRFELATRGVMGPGGRLVAYDASGRQWTTTFEGSVAVTGPARLTERYFVFSEDLETEQRWHVLDRTNGSEALVVHQEPAFGIRCGSQDAVFIQQRDGIDRIDLRTLEQRRFTSLPLLLPPTRGGWRYTSCAVLDDGSLLVDAGTPRESRFVRLHPTTGAIVYALDPEDFSVGMLPEPLPAVAVLHGFGDGSDMMGVIDFEHGTLVSSREVDDRRDFSTRVVDERSWVLTRRRMGIFDPETTSITKTRALGRRWSKDDARVVGESVWIPTARRVRPDRLTMLVATADDLQRAGARALTRATFSGRARPPRTPLVCRMQPTKCVRGDGFGISRDPLPPVDSTATTPPWDLRAMHRSARRYAGALPHTETVLLGWSIVEDHRPLRNHNALVLVVHREGRNPKYSLVTMYRHAVNTEWNIPFVLHAERRPVVTFDHRPTVAEVEEVLTINEWQLEGEHFGFFVLAGAMPEDVWREALGGPPSRPLVRAPPSQWPSAQPLTR